MGRLGRKTVWLIGAILSLYPKAEVQLVSPRKWVRELHGDLEDKDKYKEASLALARTWWDPKTQHEADALCLLTWWRKTCQPKLK